MLPMGMRMQYQVQQEAPLGCGRRRRPSSEEISTRAPTDLHFFARAPDRDGVMLAADTLASYGSLARYKNVERLKP